MITTYLPENGSSAEGNSATTSCTTSECGSRSRFAEQSTTARSAECPKNCLPSSNGIDCTCLSRQREPEATLSALDWASLVPTSSSGASEFWRMATIADVFFRTTGRQLEITPIELIRPVGTSPFGVNARGMGDGFDSFVSEVQLTGYAFVIAPFSSVCFSPEFISNSASSLPTRMGDYGLNMSRDRLPATDRQSPWDHASIEHPIWTRHASAASSSNTTPDCATRGDGSPWELIYSELGAPTACAPTMNLTCCDDRTGKHGTMVVDASCAGVLPMWVIDEEDGPPTAAVVGKVIALDGVILGGKVYKIPNRCCVRVECIGKSTLVVACMNRLLNILRPCMAQKPDDEFGPPGNGKVPPLDQFNNAPLAHEE